MEFPEPTIDVDSAARALILGDGHPGERSGRDGSWPARDLLQAIIAQAWEEGRWSPPGATHNPYGEPAQPVCSPHNPQLPGAPLVQLRAAARAALAWLENMAPTVKRTALAEQLRAALDGQLPSCGKHGFCHRPAAHRGPCLSALQIEKERASK